MSGPRRQVGDVLRATLAAVREHNVRVDARYATAVINLLCIESFASKLDPEYNLLDESEPLLRAHAALGQRALQAVLPLISPAVAGFRYLEETLLWRVPALLKGREEELLIRAA